MWEEWDSSAIRDELKRMRELGINSFRFFLLAEDFGDEEGRLREEALGKLGEFLRVAEEEGLKAFPTLIVGHMSGKNWPIPWDPEGRVYDKELVSKYVNFVKAVVKRFKGYNSVAGWILTNEITLVKEPRGLKEFRGWLKALYEAVKSEDPRRPVSLGDSTSYLGKLCLKPENVIDYVDLFSPHLYLYDPDPVRHTLTYASVIEYCRSLGKPVLLEEFGYPTSLYGEESHARFIKVILTLALALGAEGAFVWCFSDFVREGDEPYLWEPHELTFGILRKDGSEKPAAKVVKEFAKVLERAGEARPVSREAAIMVPEHLYRDFPFHNLPRLDEGRALAEAFVLAKGASMPVTFVREGEELKGFKLIIVPSISRLKTTTWRGLLDWVEGGGTLYYSSARYLNSPHMSATHLWEELFGVRPSLRAGSPGLPVEGGELKLVEDLPPLRKGDSFKFEATPALAVRRIGRYDFELSGARLIATYRGGMGLTVFEVGEGRALLSPHPLELMLAWHPRPDRVGQGYHRLYSALANLAGLRPLFYCEDPRVEVEYLESGDGYLLALINHSYEAVTATVVCRGTPEVEWYEWCSLLIKPPYLEASLGPKSSALVKLKVSSTSV